MIGRQERSPAVSPGHVVEPRANDHRIAPTTFGSVITDLGLGAYELGYIRDKQEREVDFVVTREGEPWFLIEVKHRETPIGPARTFLSQLL